MKTGNSRLAACTYPQHAALDSLGIHPDTEMGVLSLVRICRETYKSTLYFHSAEVAILRFRYSIKFMDYLHDTMI